jgi:ribosome recycling factor
MRSVIKDIERAITNSNLGLSTSVDDKGLRLNFSELTGERRRCLCKEGERDNKLIDRCLDECNLE